MSQVFDVYAQYYDLVYQDKDYAGEAEYVHTSILKHSPSAKTILELGCGTGTHAELLAHKGYRVHGIDMSTEMLARAEARKAALPGEIGDRLSFGLGDVRSVRMQQTYDVVISLFHVISYQASNEDLRNVFETAATQLSSGGIFLFDFWYGPAVLNQKPDVRVKRLESQKIRVTRIAEPLSHVNGNCVDVNYDIFIEQKKTGEIAQVKEVHKMRYLFLPELEYFLSSEKWAKYESFEWLSEAAPNEDSWSAFVVAKRK